MSRSSTQDTSAVGHSGPAPTPRRVGGARDPGNRTRSGGVPLATTRAVLRGLVAAARLGAAATIRRRTA